MENMHFVLILSFACNVYAKYLQEIGHEMENVLFPIVIEL